MLNLFWVKAKINCRYSNCTNCKKLGFVVTGMPVPVVLGSIFCTYYKRQYYQVALLFLLCRGKYFSLQQLK